MSADPPTMPGPDLGVEIDVDVDPDTSPFVDANAVAGMLREIFATDITGATGTCAGCGRTSHLAQARLYGRLPGVVLRCAGCGHLLARVVATARHVRFDLGGLTSVTLARPADVQA